MSIFKAYDIRGVYPEEINEDWAYRIGRAFAAFIIEESGKDEPVIFLSKDNRVSSDSLYEEVKRGMISQGGKVVSGGLASTPMFYFGVANYGFDGGICVTASHNPGKYNGFKMVKAGAVPVGESSGLKRIEELANQSLLESGNGETENKEILEDYVQKNDFFGDYPFRVLIDTANGIAGLPAGRLLNKDNFVSIFPELDGTFPNHDPDPLKKGNLDILCQRVVVESAALGIAFDGDGDRVFFVDEKGEVVSCDLVTALVAEVLLRQNKGIKVLYDIRCSNIVGETIEINGGKAIMNRVGHTFIKQKMREEDVFFGGEYSGHFYLKDSFYAENPFFVISVVLEELKNSGLTLSEVMAKYRKYYHSGEINFKVEDKQKKIDEIMSRYGDGKLIDMDGIRIDYEDWWLLVRGSNTEPLLRLIVEAKTEDLLKEKVLEISNIIES
ncbi:MAG: Phosphomannomutase/phosphoglucomutase [Parcubacteria group bacterium ADurb.Bin216]|nr:MAG: Phosphomannomutase/phosphoglucomutase [Parcubacteria group bacterium ADurb.Bin216]